MTTREAAKALDISDARVRQLIYAGRLPSTKVGRYNLIEEKDLDLIRNRPRGGRPKKSANV